MSNVESTSTGDLPTVKEVNDWDTKRLKENLKNIDKYIDTITEDQPVDGDAFLKLASSKILDLIKEIKGKQGEEELIEGLEEQTDESRRIIRTKEYMDTVQNSLEADPPSISAEPRAFSTGQKNFPILNGRPLDCTGPPITLYNRTFGEFLENFENVNLDISSDIFEWVTNLIYVATAFYENKDERMVKVRDTLSAKWSIELIEYQRKSGKGRSSDGVFTAKIKNKFVAYVGFMEGKNEIGSGGCDPSVQGAICYRDYWSQVSVKQIRDYCCIPSFIITVAGPWFCVLGAVYLNRVVVQPLTDSIPFTVSLRNDEHVTRIARLFQALDIAFDHLSTFYQELNISSPSDKRFFPYIQQAVCEDITFTFTYISELLDDHSRPIWKAMRDDDKSMIVVKFAHKYNVQAHNICARENYTPKLLYSSNDKEAKKLGGYKMIIMEYIDGILLGQKIKKREIKVKNNIYDNVRAAVKLLHDENLVFADLRTPNILVVDINGCQQAKLIDFDWCGVYNKDKYPPSINLSIKWPPGVKPYALLQKDHDLYWLKELNELMNAPIKSPVASMKSSDIPQSPTVYTSRSSIKSSYVPQSFASGSSITKSDIPQSPTTYTPRSAIRSSYVPQGFASGSSITSSVIPQSSTPSESRFAGIQKCKECDCEDFSPNLYREGLCKNCFHAH